MKLKGRIIQIVEHKNWNSYFGFSSLDKPRDVINMRPPDEPSVNGIIDGLLLGLFRIKEILTFKKWDWKYLYYDMPHIVDRPHDFKVGDVVELDINVYKVVK